MCSCVPRAVFWIEQGSRGRRRLVLSCVQGWERESWRMKVLSGRGVMWEENVCVGGSGGGDGLGTREEDLCS